MNIVPVNDAKPNITEGQIDAYAKHIMCAQTAGAIRLFRATVEINFNLDALNQVDARVTALRSGGGK